MLLGTVLLAVLGFGLGVAAGLVLEEPRLLLDYLTGRTTSAPLDAAREARDLPEPAPPVAEPQAAAVPAALPATPAEGGEPSAAEPEPVARDVDAPPPAREIAPPADDFAEGGRTDEAEPSSARQGGFSVQVGALADAASAEQLAAKLRQRGFSVYVAPSAEPGSRRWRVRVGPVPTRAEAEQLASRLEREKLPTWVLAEGPR
jgi:DedD protein